MKHRIFLSIMLLALSLTAMAVDGFEIPAADKSGRVGALMPYTRYDSHEAVLGGGASLVTSSDWGRMNIASQASAQSYVTLPGSGAYAEWTMTTTGDGVCMRFTLPDTANGMGQNGSLDVYINNVKVQTVSLTSYFMWQYFSGGSPNDTNNGGVPAFAFDEVHFRLSQKLQKGDRIRIESSGEGGLEYGVDFLEIEEVPDPLECPDDAVNVADYCSESDADVTTAFEQALKDADNGSKVLYIPEGTWRMGRIWKLYCSGVKIMGAGMWYTNIQFTSANRQSGGISGGNGYGHTGDSKYDGYCRDMEFCHMYINSHLRSRYGENAVYKCFMDVFPDNCVFHDIWEEHFECGFWFGDYNGNQYYSDGVKVINCRIRNNLADGVNFCMGTSRATVYNCSVRNNGDDGLAMWNNSERSSKDEQDNVFCYNTIDFIWRAGGIAIYGGNGHRIYNNYICDMFMASGIHLNTIFSGHKFNNNTRGITFDNNILVRCGTVADCYNEDLNAIDLKGDVKNITFNNTYIYDSPGGAIRVRDNLQNITFNNTKVIGAGLSGQDVTYSCVRHSACAMRVENENVKFNGLEIAAVSPDRYTGYEANSTWPIWNDRNKTKYSAWLAANDVTINTDPDVAYTVPAYPAPDNTPQGGGIIDPLDGITGYDLIVSRLGWQNADGSAELHEGETVSLLAEVKNASAVAIPEGVQIALRLVLDDETVFTVTTKKTGLKAGETVVLSPARTWTAVQGGHTLTATVDPQDKLPGESDEQNNERVKHFNVALAQGSNKPLYTPVTGRYDIVITDVAYTNETTGTQDIRVGDVLRFSATIVNAGDKEVPAGKKLGIQWQIDGNTSVITWSDTHNDGLKPGQSVVLTANGGNPISTWKATSGTHTLTGWIDDTNVYGEMNEANNRCSITLNIPYQTPQLWDNPDQSDFATSTSVRSVARAASSSPGYSLSGIRLPQPQRGVNIRNGRKVVIK